MKNQNLIELHQLRAQEKAIKARIEQISDKATEEALAITPKGGEFQVGDLVFQAQITDVIDMSNYNRYKGEDGKQWRACDAKQAELKKQSAALTKIKAGLVEAFKANNPDWTPDEVKVTIKCIDAKKSEE